MSQRRNTGRRADVGAFNYRCMVRFEVYSPRYSVPVRGWFVRRPLEDGVSSGKMYIIWTGMGGEHGFRFGV